MKIGDFIRVKGECGDYARAGMDGMVMSPMDEDGFVGLMFGFDRHNRTQQVFSVGIEIWHRDELDMDTLTT